jgi:hypothetical protein
LNGTVSIRFGPNVVGWYDGAGSPLRTEAKAKHRGKGGSVEVGANQKQVFTASSTPLEISQKARDSHFSTAPMTASPYENEDQKQEGGGLTAASLCTANRTDHMSIKPDNLKS